MRNAGGQTELHKSRSCSTDIWGLWATLFLVLLCSPNSKLNCLTVFFSLGTQVPLTQTLGLLQWPLSNSLLWVPLLGGFFGGIVSFFVSL